MHVLDTGRFNRVLANKYLSIAGFKRVSWDENLSGICPSVSLRVPGYLSRSILVGETELKTQARPLRAC
jgi:hypothetical protein